MLLCHVRVVGTIADSPAVPPEDGRGDVAPVLVAYWGSEVKGSNGPSGAVVHLLHCLAEGEGCWSLVVGVGSIVAVAVEFDCIAWSTYDGYISVSGTIGEVGLCNGESMEGPASSGIASGGVDSQLLLCLL